MALSTIEVVVPHSKNSHDGRNLNNSHHSISCLIQTIILLYIYIHSSPTELCGSAHPMEIINN